MSNLNSDNEIDEYETTFNNYIRGLNIIRYNKNLTDAIYDLNYILDPNEISFHKACLRDYFYREYMKEVIKLSDFITEKANKSLGFISLENPKNQLAYFIEKLKENVSLKKKEIYKLAFKNNFNDLEENVIYEYFYSTLVSTKYLTENQLDSYLKMAFEELSIPDSKFKFSESPNKKTIQKVFYKFYKEKSKNTYKQKLKYVELLSNYFEGFNTSSLKSNFSKIY